MIALCVDADPIALLWLRETLAKTDGLSEVVGFSDDSKTLAWAKNHIPDIAFLETDLAGKDGIGLAAELRGLFPGLPIVFCSTSGERALDALTVHANGYLIKPLAKDTVEREVRYHLGEQRGKKLRLIRAGKSITVCDAGGCPLTFKRKKTLALFLALFETPGGLSVEQLCGKLWDDNDTMFKQNKNYLFKLFGDLKTALADADAGTILQRTVNGYFIDSAAVEEKTILS